MGAATSPASTQDAIYAICANMGADVMVADQDHSAAGDAALARAMGEDEAGQPEPEDEAEEVAAKGKAAGPVSLVREGKASRKRCTFSSGS